MQENYIKLTEDKFIDYLKAQDRVKKLEAMLEYSNSQLDNALAYIDGLNLLHNDQSTRLAELEADRRKLEAMLNA